ncbi:hypothetical protein [Inquilinus limosus]|uniref:Cobalamin-independent methionine synthase MetE C-terminal/archaeal domain-containing protein n=1 Tax=Inquilinus limosus MP06 TaxID=1398085 RepID=A0A0A0CWM6_9PROT|nr:hypothetical protein P409_35480 [Inquilinus limosus MP06]
MNIAFTTWRYPNEIGPGVHDIHSPHVPEVEEIAALLRPARQRLSGRQIRINPGCGLKTRGRAEVRPALANMAAAAGQMPTQPGTG